MASFCPTDKNYIYCLAPDGKFYTVRFDCEKRTLDAIRTVLYYDFRLKEAQIPVDLRLTRKFGAEEEKDENGSAKDDEEEEFDEDARKW